MVYGPAKLHEVQEHFHSVQKVYPTLGNGVEILSAETSWVLGPITEIMPQGITTLRFDIHEILVEDVNVQDKTFELVLYYGPLDIECGRTRFAATSLKGGVPAVAMQTPIMNGGSRIRGRIAVSSGSQNWAKISLRYHEY